MTSVPLQLESVTKVYRRPASEVTAVRDVSLSVSEGTIVVILGPSGSGKTTLLSIAGCLLKPTSGMVRIMGRDVTGLSEGQLPEVRLRHIGFVFQTFNLLEPLTALQNVMIPMNLAGKGGAPARIRAQALMTELGLEERMSRLSQELSAGEQQRVAIARALANQPDVVLADEPTANLDSATGQRVMTLLAGLVRRGETKALVVVTHDSRILDFADQVLWMEDGTLRVDADRAGMGAIQTEHTGATASD